jgi:hypothetical protein
MEKKRKIIQVYAIIVNVVVLITFIIATTNLVSALIDRNDPIYAGNNKVDLSSFEKYKLDVLSSTQENAAYIPTDETIFEMYDSAKTDRINRVNHQTFRTFMVSSVILGLCIILFGFHWWLAKKYG